MLTFLAATPVLMVLVLMTVSGWSAARAGAVTAVVTLVVATQAFDFGGPADPFTITSGFLGVTAEAAFISTTVVGIIGPALGIHHLQQRTGAIARLRTLLTRLHPDPRLGALFVAWFFTLFLEGAAGFGTPVALAAPFLVAVGLSPVRAVAAALIGHAAGVSFGAVGTPVLAQSALVDFNGVELARATAPYHVALGGFLMIALVLTIGRSVGEGRLPWGWGALAAISFLAPYGLIATFVGPELPTLGGSLIGAGIFALVLRSRREPFGALVETEVETSHGEMHVVHAAAPYVVLIALVLATRLIPPIRDTLENLAIEWQTSSGFSGSVQPFFHPAALLSISFVAGAVIQRAPRRVISDAFTMATRQLGPVTTALIAMVAIARTMSYAGMTDQMAHTAATAGAAWPLLAPAVGAWGVRQTRPRRGRDSRLIG